MGETVTALPKLYTEEEAAEYLRFSAYTLAEERRSGKIGCIKARKGYRYTERHLLAYLAQQEKPCREPAAPETGKSENTTSPRSTESGIGPGTTQALEPRVVLALANEMFRSPSSGSQNGISNNTGLDTRNRQTS